MQRLRSIVARVRGMDPWRFDLALGAFVAVEGNLELLLIDAPASDVLAVRLLLVVLGAGLALRRRLPLIGLAVVLVAYSGMQTVGPPISDNLLLPFFSIFVAVYTLGATVHGRRLWVGAALALAGVQTAVLIDGYDDNLGNIVFSAAVMVAAPLLVGRVVAERARLSRALRERTASLERERSERAAAAVLAERTRIAGELHDVISHALGAMVVQGGAARRLAGSDPERAREALAAVEATGRDALTEMRALLGVLRREDDGIALDPQPSLAHVSTLIRRSAGAGLPVALEVEGEREAVPAGVDLVAYRVVQEALGGALESGAGRARVRVRYRPEAVEVEVVDDGRATRGLPGVRERVTLYGGELLSGARRDGGHTVRARLPVALP